LDDALDELDELEALEEFDELLLFEPLVELDREASRLNLLLLESLFTIYKSPKTHPGFIHLHVCQTAWLLMMFTIFICPHFPMVKGVQLVYTTFDFLLFLLSLDLFTFVEADPFLEAQVQGSEELLPAQLQEPFDWLEELEALEALEELEELDELAVSLL
jgi:hypothetical protein